MSPGLATVVHRRRRSLTRSADGGDAAAFAVVYERHHQDLYRYCRSILHHDQDAQDALQSTMTRAFAALQEEPRNFELRPWLFRIAHNEAISLLRRRRPADGLEELATRDAPVEEQVSLRADLQRLQQDLAALHERQRAALVLRELNGLSHAEIAQVLDCTPRAVKQSIYEARTGLLHAREGREMTCDDVCLALSDGDGRVLRGGRLRAHVRACSSCRRFQQELALRPRQLAMLAPPLPVAAGAAIIAQLLPASGAATAGLLSSSSAAGTMAALGPKAVATIAAVAAATGGTAAIRHDQPVPASQRPGDIRPARSSAPATSPVKPAAVRTPAPVTGQQDRPIRTAQRPASPQRPKAPNRAHSSGRRKAQKAKAAGTPAQPPARGRALTPPRRPANPAAARGRSQRAKATAPSARPERRSPAAPRGRNR